MSDESARDLSRLAIHTITNKPWTLRQCVSAYTARGVGGISVWRNVIEPIGADEAARVLNDSPLRIPALVRGGFFPATTAEARQRALDENRRCIDEAATIGADMVVLVVGAVPGMPLQQGRTQVSDGIAAVLPHAEARGVQLAIEPMHPMYAADKSCVNRMREARAICESLDHPRLGIALDVYHVWWDPDLADEIAIAGRTSRLFGFHICDWRVPTRRLLTDRALMGEGCVDVPGIRRRVEDAGFAGFHEVEIFSDDYWSMDQDRYLDKIIDAYRAHA